MSPLPGPDEVESWGLPVHRWTVWPGDLLVVLACSRAKLDHPAPAAQPYTGSLFALALRAARTLVDDERIRVLSARHGLVTLSTILAPYDQRWSATGRMPHRLRAQAATQGIVDTAHVLSLCPTDYWLRIAQVWPNAVNGFAGCLGVGDQRHRLSAIIRTGTPTR